MVETKANFNDRLNFLGHKHKEMSKGGYVTQMRNDGLIVVAPHRKTSRFPLKGMFLLLMGFFCFKAFMIASVGPDGYNERVATLAAGTIVEQGGAWVMQADRVSQAMANYVGPILR